MTRDQFNDFANGPHPAVTASYPIWKLPATRHIQDFALCACEPLDIPADRVIWAHRVDHGHNFDDFTVLLSAVDKSVPVNNFLYWEAQQFRNIVKNWRPSVR